MKIVLPYEHQVSTIRMSKGNLVKECVFVTTFIIGLVILLGGAALLLRRKHKKQRAQVQKAQTPDQTPVGK